MRTSFLPGSARLLSAACWLSQWDGVEGLEEGAAFVATNRALFLPGGSCCVVRVREASLGAQLRAQVLGAQPHRPELRLVREARGQAGS